MDKIVAISLINRDLDLQCPSKNLAELLSKNSKFFVRPSDFEGLKKLINSEFNPKKKRKKTLSYVGLLSTGERIEIKDSRTFKDDMSLIYVCYKKEEAPSALKLDDLNPSQYFGDVPTIEAPDSMEANLNINFEVLRRSVSSNMVINQNDQYKKFDEDLNNTIGKRLNESVMDIFKSSKDNIKINANLSKSLKDAKKKMLVRKNIAVDVMKKNSKDIEDLNNTIKKMNVSKNKPSQPNPKPKPVIEEEKIIFKFYEKIIEKEVKKTDTSIKIENIKIKNISKKEYKSNLMSWFKDKNSEANINFEQAEFKDNITYKSQQDIDNLFINLVFDNLKDENKMFISIINKENKKIISEKPLEVVLRMKKGFSEEEIEQYKASFRRELKYYNKFLNEDEVERIIKENEDNESNIKKLVKEKYDENKQTKIDDLLDKLKREKSFEDFLPNEEVKQKIESEEFDEGKVKAWIETKRPHNDPIPNQDDNKIEEIMEKFEEDFYVSSFMEEDELRQIIIDNNYDVNKIKAIIESRM